MLNLKNPLDDIEAVARALPPFPKVIVQLLDLLRDEKSSLEVMARLIRNDPVISGSILAIANRIRRTHALADLADPYAAASLIGFDHVRKVIIQVGMNRFVGSANGNQFYFQHSCAVAITSQELALLCEVSPDEAYIAGILHDVGQLCFHVLDDAAFQDAYLASTVDGRLVEREAELFGADHCQIGASLAQHWNLPDNVVSAIAAHHDEATATSPLQATINLGEVVARGLDIPASPKNRITQVNQPAMALLGLDWSQPEMVDCLGRCHARYRQGLGRS